MNSQNFVGFPNNISQTEMLLDDKDCHVHLVTCKHTKMANKREEIVIFNVM